MKRRDFLKAAAAGSAAAVLSTMGLVGSASASAEEMPGFAGKKKFAGVGAVRSITDDVIYVGVSERRTELFENVYPIPRGVSYNSYVLLDEKTVLFDTVDRNVVGQFFENLEIALQGRQLDYLIVNHMEPDHSAAISEVLVRYPNATVVCTKTAALILNQFFDCDISARQMTVGEGDTLTVGTHTLAFVMAPMVHWPEAMMTYDVKDKILFSADAFGTFGALNGNLFADEVPFKTEWLPDARRYLTNIVGKYGPQVQAVLAKAATVDIQMICPLHGPVWREDLGWFIEKYDIWSRYEPEENAVMIVYGSIYGGTESAANALADILSRSGVANVVVYDVSKTHVSELISEAFRCSHIVLASITYNMGIFTPMKNFLEDLEEHNLQNRTFSVIENGSWSPASGGKMKDIVNRMQNMTYAGETVTIHSSPDAKDYDQLTALAEAIVDSLNNGTSQAPVEKAPTAWRCKVCGYIYEAEDIPDDYVCPLCGVGPDQFEAITQ